MDFIPDVSQEVVADDQQAGDYYYYSGGKKHSIMLNTDYVFVTSEEQLSLQPLRLLRSYKVSDSKGDNASTISTRTGVVDKHWVEIELQERISEDQYMENLQQLRQMNRDIVVSPYFKTASSKKIGLSNYFYVKLKELKDSVALKEMAIETKAKVVGADSYMPLWYVVSVTPESGKNALEMANSYYESKKFQYAEPDFMEDNLIDWEPNDPYLEQQWGVRNYNLDLAWEISKGDDVRIAILDQGILNTHPDLLDKIIVSYDTESNTTPSKLLGGHGTMCAGVAAANGNNNVGIIGVAPNAKLLDISNSLDAVPLSRMKRADGIMMAWQFGADVISNSWGSSVQYTQIDEAINSAVRYGRNGKGCVVVFASGNDYKSTVGYPSVLSSVISVGAIGSNNKRADYSNYGTQLDFVAPGSSIYTTNYSGGYEFTNGTSFACPYVAGVAALILSANPDLKGFEVEKIIRMTCRKLSSYSFAKPDSYSDATWNQEVGYGLVDAYEALQMVVNPAVDVTFTFSNPSNSTHLFYCSLVDDTGTTVWNQDIWLRIPSERSVNVDLKLKPGNYTLIVNTPDAYEDYVNTFEVKCGGSFMVELMSGIDIAQWDPVCGYWDACE